MTQALLQLTYIAVAVVGVALTLLFQSMVPAHPNDRDLLITASLVSFYGIACLGPLTVSLVHSNRVHGSLRPALRTIALFLVVGLIWAAVKDRSEGAAEDIVLRHCGVNHPEAGYRR